jgi:hypothetical protein
MIRWIPADVLPEIKRIENAVLLRARLAPGAHRDLPCIGVTKRCLVGEHGRPAARRGAWTPLIDGGEMAGAVLRTRTGAKPVRKEARRARTSGIDGYQRCAWSSVLALLAMSDVAERLP